MTWQKLGPEQVAQLKAFQSGHPLPFRLKMKGYHRIQVEAYLYKVAELMDADSPAEIEPPAFEVVMRGYDRRQVDAFIGPLHQTPNP
ncbi:DivIVA domain-containing protein [Actinomadura welshii]|uniref:DivIVA domain-containing protein n=1 Tax=Actinomadura welshii TaxID=3103817 RepID=UPI0003AD2E01|nr:DivIVA domain-containing protein [Actinomadura madurae]